MARGRGGGGNVAVSYLQTGMQLLIMLSAGIAVVFIIASVLGGITQQFPVTQTNPLYNITRAFSTITTSVSNMVPQLVIIGVASLIIIAVVFILRVFF